MRIPNNQPCGAHAKTRDMHISITHMVQGIKVNNVSGETGTTRKPMPELEKRGEGLTNMGPENTCSLSLRESEVVNSRWNQRVRHISKSNKKGGLSTTKGPETLLARGRSSEKHFFEPIYFEQ